MGCAQYATPLITAATRQSFPPGGSLEIRHLFEFLNSLLQSVHETAPHPSPFGDTFPPGGRL